LEQAYEVVSVDEWYARYNQYRRTWELLERLNNKGIASFDPVFLIEGIAVSRGNASLDVVLIKDFR